MKRLPAEEEQIVLRAMHHVFVSRGLCIRESTELGALLIFPSYYKRERPHLTSHPVSLVTYRFSGQLDETYATLIVKLHHTIAFQKDQLWNFAADFLTQSGKRVGVKMTKTKEGNAELLVYADPDIPDDTKVTFVKYVHQHLESKVRNLERIRNYSCSRCRTPVLNHDAVQARLDDGETTILCIKCERRILLFDTFERRFASAELTERVLRLERRSRATLENQSRQLIVFNHVLAVVAEAGEQYRPATNPAGIDGVIDFRGDDGQRSSAGILLQIKSEGIYQILDDEAGQIKLRVIRGSLIDGWLKQQRPIMIVLRGADEIVSWMDVSEPLRSQQRDLRGRVVFTFAGEPLTATALRAVRERAVKSAQQTA